MTSAIPQYPIDRSRLSDARAPHIRARRLLAATIITLALTGCADEAPTAVAGPPLEARRGPPARLRDPEINTSDTYFAVHMTTTTDAPPGANMARAGTFYSPESYSAPWNSNYVEVGYDAAGQFRFNVYRAPSSDPMIPSPPSLVRIAGGNVFTYDQQGTLTQQRPFNEYFEGAGLPGGSTVNATPIYVWGCNYDAVGNCEGGAASGAAPVAFAGRGEAERVRQHGDTLLEVSTPLTPADDAAMTVMGNVSRVLGAEVVRQYKRANMPVKGPSGNAKDSRRWLIHTHTFRTIRERGGRRDTSANTVTFRFVAMHIDEPRQRQRERSEPERPARRGASSVAAPAAAAPTVTAAAAVQCAETRSGPRGSNYSGRLVWQHGWMSSSDTWCRMRDTVMRGFRVGYDQAYTTSWEQGMATQANTLAGLLNRSLSPSQNVVIAHSQGGLIARSLGQRYPSLVSGVVTVGTPHLGAHIASFSRSTLEDLLSEAISDGCSGGTMCFLIDMVSDQIASGLLTLGLSETLPAANDLAIGSSFVTNLNSTYEPFRRASIQADVPPRWAIFRLIGDASSNPSRLDDLDGEQRVKDAETVYHAAQMMLALSLSSRWWTDDYGPGIRCYDHYYRNYWPPCTQPQSYQLTFWSRPVWSLITGYLELFARVMTAGMDRLDHRWTYMTTGYQDNARGDAFIQYNSQVYPNVPGAFTPVRLLVAGRPSHTGETSSLGVFHRLSDILPVMGILEIRPDAIR